MATRVVSRALGVLLLVVLAEPAWGAPMLPTTFDTTLPAVLGAVYV